MKTLLLFVLLFGVAAATAQHIDVLPATLQAKTAAIKEGKLSDSVLYSTIGFFVKKGYVFSKVTEYKILTTTKGYYFKFDFANDIDAVVVSFVYFIPHIRLTEEQQKDPAREFAPNEHLCICAAKTGQAVIKMNSGGFTCAGALPAWDDPSNLEINCHDTEHRSRFFELYYAEGQAVADSVATVKPQFME